MSEKPEIVSVQQVQSVTQSRRFIVESVHLRFSNGVERHFERVPCFVPGAVLIVPVLNDDTLLLIREYSVGTDRYELGFPKGAVDAEEALLDAANRELMEEIGFGARQLTVLRKMSIAPSYFAHQTDIVLAQDLYSRKLPGDEPEPLEVVHWPLRDWQALLKEDDFTEARSIAALFLVREQLGVRDDRPCRNGAKNGR